MYHRQEEASLWNGAKAWSCWVFISDGLQRNRLHTCYEKDIITRLDLQNWLKCLIKVCHYLDYYHAP